MNIKEKYKRRVDLAAGRGKVELLLKNCKIINVFSHNIVEGNIALDGGKIIGIGDYEAQEIRDMAGKYVAPGLIDSHEHMESAMVTPWELARVVVPKGTTTIIADPHEIANVCGLQGLDFMMSATENLPINVFFMLPSCVPATIHEHSGAKLEAKDLSELMNHPHILGLGELMDYPGVINGRADIIDKVILADQKMIDGHSPLVTGKDLNAYVINGVRTDHECTNAKEMMEKLGLGIYIAIREGSAARDLEKLIPHVNQQTERRVTLCTDDKHPGDILNEGHIDHNVRKAIALGMDPISAITMATLNAAECYRLRDIGAIAPGYDADLIVLDDLESVHITEVYKKGRRVASEGKLLIEVQRTDTSEVTNTVNIGTITKENLRIPLRSDIARVIRLTPGSLLTELVVRKVSINENNEFIPNRHIDVLKVAVIERHRGSGLIGLGLIENMKIRGGAIGTTIAHDSHNLIVVGDNDEDMLLVIEEIKKMQGGIAVASNGKIVQRLELPIAGIMSDRKMEEVSQKIVEILAFIHTEMGADPSLDPLMTLSFMALPVIPSAKITDMGLFDVDRMQFISLDVEE